MSLVISYILFFILLNNQLMACEHGFFPTSELNKISISENSFNNQALSAKIIEEIKKVYDPIFKKEGKELKIEILWNEANVNAYATRDDNNNPTLKITGGMARHDLLSPDGLRLILCHEIGHFLGGEPKKLRGRSSKRSWSSAEGQADYYANAVCMKKLLSIKNQKSISKFESRYIEEVNQICDNPLCKKIALASINVAKVYASIQFFRSELSLLYQDTTTVYNTLYSHPNPQCRLDTMMAALQCKGSEELEFNLHDPISGACKDPSFRRPRCWYYPEI